MARTDRAIHRSQTTTLTAFKSERKKRKKEIKKEANRCVGDEEKKEKIKPPNWDKQHETPVVTYIGIFFSPNNNEPFRCVFVGFDA